MKKSDKKIYLFFKQQSPCGVVRMMKKQIQENAEQLICNVNTYNILVASSLGLLLCTGLHWRVTRLKEIFPKK